MHPLADVIVSAAQGAFPPADGSGLVVLGTGVAGLPEVSIEIEAGHRGRGLAGAMLRSVRSTSDGPVVAMVSPGNAASLRAFLAAGFSPIGSAQVWHR